MLFRFALLHSLIFVSCFLEGAINPTASSATVHEAFVSPVTDVLSPTPISTPPPALPVENKPSQPSPDTVWIPGYFAWHHADYVWICGVWRRPPPSHTWIAGQWTQTAEGWVWKEGFWSPLAVESLAYLATPPPASLNENVPPSAGNDHFWIPGYWLYDQPTATYVWLQGKWEPFHKDWILTPASYHLRSEGCVFVPSYWDWPLELRGTAYRCEALTPLQTEEIVEQLFLCYPNYLTLFWHCWHFYPQWWEGCSCAPSWWYWKQWWTFSWADTWGLWWWWGHPGSLPPAWLTTELSLKITAPSAPVLEAFKALQRPAFKIPLGETAFLPQAPAISSLVPKPLFPQTPSERQVTTPSFPRTQALPPVPIPFPHQFSVPTSPQYPLTPNKEDNPAVLPSPPGKTVPSTPQTLLPAPSPHALSVPDTRIPSTPLPPENTPSSPQIPPTPSVQNNFVNPNLPSTSTNPNINPNLRSGSPTNPHLQNRLQNNPAHPATSNPARTPTNIPRANPQIRSDTFRSPYSTNSTTSPQTTPRGSPQ